MLGWERTLEPGFGAGAHVDVSPSANLTATVSLYIAANAQTQSIARQSPPEALCICLSRPTLSHDYLCPPYRTRTFTCKALQQHLSSCVHAQRSTPLLGFDDVSFHCPRTLMG